MLKTEEIANLYSETKEVGMSEYLEYHICDICKSRVAELDECKGQMVCEDCFAELEGNPVATLMKHGKVDYEPDNERG